MPVPTPTPEEIAAVQEITAELSYAFIEAKVNALNDAQWKRILNLKDLYEAAPQDTTRLTGKVDDDPERDRASLKRRMRRLLGMSALSDDEQAALPGSVVVHTSLGW